MSDQGDVTMLLHRISDGDEQAAEDLAPLVYEELQLMARRALTSQRRDHTLQSTALINEAWIRLVGVQDQEWSGRAHFLGVAAKAMRSVLVDHARKGGSLKRGGGMRQVTLDHAVLSLEEKALDLLALEEALDELEEFDAGLARIVELRFFGGLSHPEIATVTGAPLRRIERGWRTARAWLHQRIDSL